MRAQNLFNSLRKNWLLRQISLTLKQSLYRPGQALRFPGGWGSQTSTQSAHRGGKFVSPTHRPPLPPRRYSWCSFWLSRPQGHISAGRTSIKNSNDIIWNRNREGWGSKISKQSAHGGGIVSPTHRPTLSPRRYSWCSFWLNRPQGHIAAGRMPINNSSDTIWNRTRNLPARSAVVQPTAPPCAPTVTLSIWNFKIKSFRSSSRFCTGTVMWLNC